MRFFRRQHAILIAAAGLIASTALLIGLRIGRPVYYSDGERTLAAQELRHASMLRWGAPQPELALPGPVRGRVAQLPDGRLLYGRARSPKQTDLVLFDPDYPTQEPEPVLALSSAGHDLAPVVTDDGTCTVWFASDRGGGAGGFDLYRARYHQGIFYGLAPLDLPGVNTAFDETDPAPDPQGQQLVFVRRDPGFREGRNATLWIASLAGAFDPRLLFAPDQHTSQHTARGPLPPLDRDPAFSMRGKALYFVRQQPLEAPVLMQTFLHRGRFVAPLPVDITPGRTAMRGPVLLAGGFDLRLVASASAEDEAVVYRSRAREVRPYWDGQRWIEHLLVSLVFVFLTLLVLLTLGARWHQLDLITKLFLLSVAVHLLMLLWLSRMEIVRSFFPDQPKPGPRDVEVTLLAAAGNRTTGTDAVVAQTFDVSHETEFSPRESALDATAPGGEVLRQERRFAPANTPRAELRPTATSPSRTVVEPVPAVETRSGRSEQAVVAATKIPKTRMRPQQIAARQRQQQQQPRRPIEVTVPGTDVPRTSPKARPHPDAGTLAAAPPPRPTPNPPRADAPRLQDAPAQAAARTQAAEPGTRIKPPVTAVPTPAVAVLKPDARRPGSENPARDLDVRPAGSLVARKQDRAAAPAMPSGPTSPLHLEPRPMAAGAAAVALNDALRTRTPTPATTATPTQGIPTDETPPSAHLGDVAQARADTDRTAPQHNPSNATPMTTPGGPASPSLVASPTRRAQPSEMAPTPTRTPTPTRRVFADLAELDDVPEHAGSIAVPTKTGSSAAKASAPVLPDLVPQRSGLIPPRRHHSRPGTRIGSAPITGGLRIPGSFLERASRRHRLPQSASEVAALDAGLFRNRFGAARQAALEKYGGGADTERAVRLGLDYLARIQNRDGSWGRRKRHSKYGRVQVGKTALCLLAFLGAGHTHQSKTRHSKVARQALDFLVAIQDQETGHFGHTSAYSHGIATYALAECYAMTKDTELTAPLEYAVTWTLVNQNHTRDARNRGGWGYFSATLRPEDNYARASTTAWQVMALKSAQLSGIKVSDKHLRLAEKFLWNCYDRRYRLFLYTRKPSRLRSAWRTLPASTPASVFCLLLLGNDPEDPRLRAGLEYTVDRRPRRYARHSDDQFVRRGAGNVYFWYYGSLAAFMAGGDSWRTWNRALKRVLLRGQSEDGSFRPIDRYAEYADDNDRDRSYTTAMCVLSLEVYYRYFTPLLKQR